MQQLWFFIVVISLIFILFLIFSRFRKRPVSIPKEQEIVSILNKHVLFYRRLSTEDQALFKRRLLDFLSRVSIEGVQTEVNNVDRILVASGALIPIFSFPTWHYPNLTNILLYPGNFDENFDAKNKKAVISGMVGSGYMNGQMAISKDALYQGFRNHTSAHNTAIHEFVHLLDKADGSTDGVPELLLQKGYIAPWIKLVHGEMKRIAAGKSDIDAYALTNEAEFLAVVAEYFFEKPSTFEKQHPKLYHMLEEMFSKKD